eukprot:gene13210-15609_t
MLGAFRNAVEGFTGRLAVTDDDHRKEKEAFEPTPSGPPTEPSLSSGSPEQIPSSLSEQCASKERQPGVTPGLHVPQPGVTPGLHVRLTTNAGKYSDPAGLSPSSPCDFFDCESPGVQMQLSSTVDLHLIQHAFPSSPHSSLEGNSPLGPATPPAFGSSASLPAGAPPAGGPNSGNGKLAGTHRIKLSREFLLSFREVCTAMPRGLREEDLPPQLQPGSGAGDESAFFEAELPDDGLSLNNTWPKRTMLAEALSSARQALPLATPSAGGREAASPPEGAQAKWGAGPDAAPALGPFSSQDVRSSGEVTPARPPVHADSRMSTGGAPDPPAQNSGSPGWDGVTAGVEDGQPWTWGTVPARTSGGHAGGGEVGKARDMLERSWPRSGHLGTALGMALPHKDVATPLPARGASASTRPAASAGSSWSSIAVREARKSEPALEPAWLPGGAGASHEGHSLQQQQQQEPGWGRRESGPSSGKRREGSAAWGEQDEGGRAGSGGSGTWGLERSWPRRQGLALRLHHAASGLPPPAAPPAVETWQDTGSRQREGMGVQAGYMAAGLDRSWPRKARLEGSLQAAQKQLWEVPCDANAAWTRSSSTNELGATSPGPWQMQQLPFNKQPWHAGVGRNGGGGGADVPQGSATAPPWLRSQADLETALDGGAQDGVARKLDLDRSWPRSSNLGASLFSAQPLRGAGATWGANPVQPQIGAPSPQGRRDDELTPGGGSPPEADGQMPGSLELSWPRSRQLGAALRADPAASAAADAPPRGTAAGGDPGLQPELPAEHGKRLEGHLDQ